MTDNTAPRAKKLKINVVEIALPDGAIQRFYVRHFDPRQAKAALLDGRVESRIADQQDIVDMVTGKFTVFGKDGKPETALDDVDEAQQSRFQMEPPTTE